MTVTIRTRRRVGATALELPVFGFGAAHLGELYGPVLEEDAQATLKAAWDSGVRYFDTAAWYGRGLSEHRVGGFLRTHPRKDFLISTKVGRTLHRPADPTTFDRGPWIGGLNFDVRFDYSYDGLMRSYEQALQRLALDTVDALVIHDLDAGFHDPETLARHRRDLAEGGMKALSDLKSSGQIKAFGMGVNTNDAFEQIALAVELDFLVVAMPYTLLDQDSLHRGMAECVRRGISVIVGAPFASGILVTGSKGAMNYGYSAAPAHVQEKLRGLEAVTAAHGVALPAAALQFALAHPAVAAIIPGAAKAQEVTQNVAAVTTPIPAAFWAELRERGLIARDAPVPGQPTV